MRYHKKTINLPFWAMVVLSMLAVSIPWMIGPDNPTSAFVTQADAARK